VRWPSFYGANIRLFSRRRAGAGKVLGNALLRLFTQWCNLSLCIIAMHRRGLPPPVSESIKILVSFAERTIITNLLSCRCGGEPGTYIKNLNCSLIVSNKQHKIYLPLSSEFETHPYCPLPRPGNANPILIPLLNSPWGLTLPVGS